MGISWRSKTCISCLKTKPLSEFHKNCAMPDGHIRRCAVCEREVKRLRRLANLGKHLKLEEAARRRRGIPTIDQSLGAHTKKGREAEHVVAQYLRRGGWKVKMGNGKGPDLMAKAYQGWQSVEVKTVWQDTRKTSWYTSAVTPNRQKDNFIAIVWSKGKRKRVHFEPMHIHLHYCSRSGKRCVSDIVKGQYE